MKKLLMLTSILVVGTGLALAQSSSSTQDQSAQPSNSAQSTDTNNSGQSSTTPDAQQNEKSAPTGVAASQSGGAPSQDSGAVGTKEEKNDAGESSRSPKERPSDTYQPNQSNNGSATDNGTSAVPDNTPNSNTNNGQSSPPQR